MRVLILLEDLLVGGAQVQALALAERLQAGGAEVRLAILGAEVSPALRARTRLPLTACRQTGLGAPGEWRRLAAALAGERPDVVLAVNPVAGSVAAAARVQGVLKAPVAAVFHSTAVATAAGWLRTGGFLLAARACDALVFVSEQQRRHWNRRGLRCRRTEVIGNGIARAHFPVADPAMRQDARRALGLSPDALMFGAVAMFRPEKNHRQMLHALARLRAGGRAAELLLVGDGPLRPAIGEAVAALGLAGAVHFAGEQGEVAPYLRAMEVGLLCSTSIETSPLFAMELMATGAPLIASRVGGLEELVQDEVDGLLFPVNDTDALVARMARCADPAVREPLGRAAAMGAERFCADAMAARYGALLQDLAGAA